MRTAKEWYYEYCGTLFSAQKTKLVEAIQQDAYAQGVRDAAALVQTTPIYNDNPMETSEQKFHRVCDTFEKAILSLLTTPNEKQEGKE